MRRTIPCFLFALAMLVAVPAALAGTFVEFNDGRFLEVRSHELLDGWVRLVLGPGSSIVIPAGNVVIIERNDRVVYRHAPDALATEPALAKVQPPVPSLRRQGPTHRGPEHAPGSRVATRRH